MSSDRIWREENLPLSSWYKAFRDLAIKLAAASASTLSRRALSASQDLVKCVATSLSAASLRPVSSRSCSAVAPCTRS